MTPFYNIGTHVVYLEYEGGFDNPDNHYLVKSTKQVEGKTLYTISRDEMGTVRIDIAEDELFPIDEEGDFAPLKLITTNRSKLAVAKKLLAEIRDEWNEDNVLEYGISMSFDEFVAELMTVEFK